MNEADTRANYTDPQLRESNWKPEPLTLEYQFTDEKRLEQDKELNFFQ